MEEALRKRGYEADVVNLGRSGSNSTQAVDGLEQALALHPRPDAILFMSGNNDGWNFAGVDRRTLADASGASAVWLQAAERLRLFQLARAAALWLTRRRDPDELLGDGRFTAARDALSDRADPPGLLKLTAADLALGRYQESSMDFQAYLNLGWQGHPPRTVIRPDLVRDELERLAYLELGLPPERLFEGPPAQFPQDNLLRFLGRGWCRLAQRHFSAAEAEFSRAAALRTSSTDRARALEALAWARLLAGRSAEAAPFFQRAAESLAPLGRDFWSKLGLDLAQAGSGRSPAGAFPVTAADARFASRHRDCWRRLLDSKLQPPDRLDESWRLGCSWLHSRGRSLNDVPPITPLEDRLISFVEIPDRALERKMISRNVARLARLTRVTGAFVAVLGYPQATSALYSGWLTEAAKAAELPFIGLSPPDADDPRLISNDGYHLNERGYAKIAQALAAELPLQARWVRRGTKGS